MPKAPKHGNKIENVLIQNIEIKKKIQAIEYVSSRLGLMSRQVLYA